MIIDEDKIRKQLYQKTVMRKRLVTVISSEHVVINRDIAHRTILEDNNSGEIYIYAGKIITRDPKTIIGKTFLATFKITIENHITNFKPVGLIYPVGKDKHNYI